MAGDDIRIRAYNVGLGDCFLLTFPDGDVTRNMLIDFGCAPGQSQVAFQPIVENIHKETEGHLDVVVLSNDHIDHMCGFLSQRKAFDKITVDYVWMGLNCQPSFYEEESGETLGYARKLAREFNDHLRKKNTKMARSFENVLLNNLGSGEQIEYIRGLTRNREEHVLYLKRGDSVLDHPFTKEVSVDVLAPDEDMSSYYPNWDYDEWDDIQDLTSISNRLDAKLSDEKREEHPLITQELYYGACCIGSPPNLASRDWRLLKKRNDSFGVQEIRAIDSAFNNASLVLLLNIKGRKLLFTGDAETASWNRMAYCDACVDLDEPAEDCPDCADRFKSIDFLKLSQHGSKTGTPEWLSDYLKPSATVMVSTKSHVYGTKHPIPDPDLVVSLVKNKPDLNFVSTNGSDKLWVDVTLKTGDA